MEECTPHDVCCYREYKAPCASAKRKHEAWPNRPRPVVIQDFMTAQLLKVNCRGLGHTYSRVVEDMIL